MRLENCWNCSELPQTRLAASLSVSLTSGVKGTLAFVLTHHLWGLIDICGRGRSIIDQSTVIQKQDVMFRVVSSRWQQ